MAGFRKIYTSQSDYLKDLAQSTGYYSDAEYSKQVQQAQGDNYLALLASLTETGTSKTFDPILYDKLPEEERFNYLVNENFADKSSKEYLDTAKYYAQREKQIQNQETYNSVNDFQKIIGSIGGWVGNAFLQLGGIVEGLVDVGATAVGAVGGLFDEQFGKDVKNFIAGDAIGYNAAQTAMNDWINKYTFIDKNIVTRAVNDITTGIVRMTPMIIGGVLAPVTGGVSAKIGTAVYYLSMAGNESEQAIQTNPDIDYGSLLGYVGGSVGLEALTEWASGKLFGDDIISSLMKGQKYAPTGSIIKNIAKNFGTEALEEAVSELFGSMLYKGLVDQTADIASIGDIFYAAVIGGLTGAIMSGGQILTTKRKSVLDGKLVDTSKLTKEQRKSAKNLNIRESWGLNNLLSQSQQALQSTDEVTKLLNKKGVSLSELQTKYTEEYQKAVRKDTDTKALQAEAILDLANLMNTIGVEQFQRSAQLLNDNIEEARIMTDNFLNHTDVINKNASDVFSKNFEGRTFTAKAQPTNSEQTLARVLREVYPGLQVVFGDYGSRDGLAVRDVNVAGNYLFIKSGLVDSIGYNNLLNQTIKTELSEGVFRELSTLAPEWTDSITKLLLNKDVKYKDLSDEQKRTLAQEICFDPINNKRVFKGNNKLHKQIFKHITTQADKVKRFGRKTDANKVKFRELLKIRNLFLNSVAETISSIEDIATVQKEYDLSNEELKTKIIDKTITTILNKNTQITNINYARDAIFKTESIDELLENRIETDKSVNFDWNSLYIEDYYNAEWVAKIKNEQQTQDFESALKAHLASMYNTTLDDRASFITILKENMTEKDVKKVADTILTKTFLDTNPTYEALLNEVANTLYTMTATDVDNNTDSIVITDDQIKGTGELDFIIGDIPDGDILLSREQRKDSRKSTGDLFRRVPSSTAKYTTNTSITGIEFSQQDDSTMDDHQKILADDYKNKTGLNLHFFKDAVVYKGEIIENIQGFVNGVNVYVRYDGTLTNEQLNLVMEHEASHKRRDAEPEKYKALREKIETSIEPELFDEIYSKYERLYEPIYGKDDPRIEEEMIINIAVGIEKPQYKKGEADNVKAFIKGFIKTSTKLMKQKISEGVRFAKQISNETKNIKSSANATTPKQIADTITSIVANSPIAYSESKGFDDTNKEYTKVAQSMIDENFSLFRKVNQENYQRIRDDISKTNTPYTDQALIIFDRALFTYCEDSSRFDEATQEKIKNQARKKQTISAQWQGLQSRRLADKTSLTEVKNKFAEQGIDVSVSNDMVEQYVPEMKNKKEFVKQIDENIAEIEQQIENATDNLDKAALNKQLKDETTKRITIDKGTNEEILDWAITNEDIVSRAAKIQKSVFEQMVEKAELAEKTEGKKAITILVDEKTGLPKPFPKATQKIQKAVKRLKSFRMWAMLTSPVSWVRNWIGNAGMTVLDSATNQLEKWMTSRLPKVDLQKLESQQKTLRSKKDLTPDEQTKLAELNAQIAQAYDFKFVETKASKELKKQIAEDYKDVLQQILNGEDISKYEGSAEKASAIARAEREITKKSQNANFGKKVWAACQTMTDWGLNTSVFGDNAVVLNSLIKNFANMVESNKQYLIKSLTAEYGKNGRGMSDARKELVEKALETKNSIDIVNAMSKADVELFMDSCKQRTFEQYFKNPNWLSKWASNLSEKHPIAASLTSLVLPFPKVAANILSMAYKYSPLGFISAIRQWSVVKQMDAAGYKGVRDAFARAKLTRTTAQATVGSIMTIAGLIFASLGFVDIDDDDYLGPSLKIGDLRISLSNLAPSMTTFSIGAAMMWAWKNDQSATLKALDVLYDNTLLGNIENVFRYGSPDKYIENMSINYFSQYVPAMLKLFAKFCTNQATIDKTGNYFERLFKTFASGIPGVANALPKKINPYTGEFLTGTGTKNVFFNLIEAISPLDMRLDQKSDTQKEAERLDTETSGLSGTFKVNDKEYDIDKLTYSKYRANYIQNNFEKILNGKQKVTVEDENGKRITTTYDKLTDKQKKNVINKLYSEATNITKIQWWVDQGNQYVVTNRDTYNEYRSLFESNNIIYKKTWTKSKFVES